MSLLKEKNEKNFPNHWETATLQDVGKLVRGVSYKKDESSKNPQNGLTPIIRANNIQDDLQLDDLVYVPSGRISEQQYIQSGDIVIAMSSGSKNLVGKAAQANRNILCGFGAFCGVVRLESYVDPDFIGYFFKSPFYKNQVFTSSSGVNINNLRRKDIENLILPIPPLNEQRRIVNKIESLFTQLDAGIQELQQAKERLQQYQRAVLKAAVEGKLTEEWRRRHREELQPASLLARRFKELMDTEYPKEGNFARYDVLGQTESLPKGWTEVKVGDILRVVRGGSPRPKGDPIYFGGDIPWIMISDVTKVDGKYVRNTKQTLTEEGAKKSRHLEKGTLILSNSGTVCVPKILATNGCIHDGFVAFPNIPLGLDKFYLYHYFNAIRPYIISRIKQGVTQVNLNTNIVRNIEVKLPPYKEQKLITDVVDSYLSQNNEMLKTVTSELQRTERLRQAILKQAFSGNLVPQDPNDEPAEKLLERIKQEQQDGKKPSKNSKDTKPGEQQRLIDHAD